MKAGRHSESAEGMAGVRVILSSTGGDDPLIDDPYAGSFLVGKYRRARWLGRTFPSFVRRVANLLNPGAVSYIGVRHRVFDDAVVAALAEGVRSVVLLGAGFDMRAFRLNAPDVTFYEIDHPDTQRVKRQVIDQHGWRSEVDTRVVHAAADLERTPLEDVLTDMPRERAIIVWEGVAWYLTEAAVRETLTALALWFPSGTEIVFDVIDTDVASGERRDRMAASHRRSCERFGEPIRWGIHRAELDAFLSTCGWTVRDLETPVTAAERLSEANGAAMAILGSPMPFFTFVTARIDGTPDTTGS